MTANEMKDFELDALFAAAQTAGPAPSDALMARIMADAAALQPAPARRVARGLQTPLWLDRIAAAFGGGGALAGVSCSMVAGVLIGLAQPSPVAALTSAWLSEAPLDSVDLFPSDITFMEAAPND